MEEESLTYQLLRMLHAMENATNAEIRDVLAELRLTHALADMLWQLDPAGPAPSMRHMAARLRCDPSTVTFLADRLEQLGYVVRTTAPTDRRTKVLNLTDGGRAARSHLVEAATTRTPIARLGSAEQRRLHTLLAKALADTAPESEGVGATIVAAPGKDRHHTSARRTVPGRSG
ncbi:MarR family winged helix-turn-helix transcriptional regulator [Jidongwangia harbinensis]|uniref:MarR family winged helix-turn-helix transcriptional regulator n=1 Tax=Jidongwangia harbinensis TaxID=2878561 RepID=UPI001CDA3301|nr:MarR family transcriptional regulator [Jidongwangia harbinensis]MCA2216547.1 MarR family transcriptional regulator [Jidongwangia harbinensis]